MSFPRKFEQLDRDGLCVKVVPELGGRIMELSLDGHNFLFVNPALENVRNGQGDDSWDGVWQNFGGEKIWVAPQGWDNDRQWAGPPDRVLDGGCFRVSKIGNSIESESPIDPRTGLQIRRKISLSDEKCAVKIDATFENFSEKSGRWSIWPVIQVAAHDFDGDRYAVSFPAENGYSVMHGVVNNPQYRLDVVGNCEVSYKYIIGKVGALSRGGWVAYADKRAGKVLVATFDFCEDAQYPSDTNVQIWSSGAGAIFSRGILRIANDDKNANPPYMELELLSPLAEISKGESFGFSYGLSVCSVPEGGSVKSYFGAGVFTEKLSAQFDGETAFISAGLGVFADGKIALKTDSGAELCEPVSVCPSCGTRLEMEVPSAKLSGADSIILEYFNDKTTLTIEEFKL